MKLERLIAIIYKLLNHEVLSASVLAEEFQVSPRTIYRDIDVICAAGFPVVSYQGMNGGYGIMDGYKMDRSLLGSYDVQALVTVLRSLSTVFEDERAQGTIERLQTIETGQDTPSVAVNLETHRSAVDVLRNLRTAITGRNVVRFEYINAKNERTTREMEPLKLHFKYSTWYMYGFCRTRRDYREFRLSRLMDLSVTEEKFEPHHDVAEDAAAAKAWQGQQEDVVIRVGTEALAEAMDHFHQAEREFHADGSMTMRIPVYQPLGAKWLWSILLSLGSGVEVLEPIALRGILKEQLQRAQKFYEDV
ncbi:putative DNA-binding transcriptional regulator YafY [Paenibacillus phyllosphaerae]|uniref:Putative DNA-binding transcriptional regulator YafY n=1 Tax=Paenibacillus phyllosphaerae TaxID=274593 RepID=A0A7W5FN30_9BACL|nr:YafY family protein [Paenibacillus phyllosphaerae]MBB3110860.1 putative DNA-binding transcriptional regulator YafY [Paenibacillus phyllosphaerae]